MPKSTGIYKRKLKSGWRYYAKVYYKTKPYNVPGGFRTEAEAKIARAEFLKKLASIKFKVEALRLCFLNSHYFLPNFSNHIILAILYKN